MQRNIQVFTDSRQASPARKINTERKQHWKKREKMLKLCLTFSVVLVLQTSRACDDHSDEQLPFAREFIQDDSWNHVNSFNYQPILLVPGN